MNWEKKEWYGNPNLGIHAEVKSFMAPYDRKVPVWVWGKENEWNFTVAAGATSDYSYTGFCPNCKSVEEAKSYVELLATNKKLIK